jgi:hypothetical protein
MLGTLQTPRQVWGESTGNPGADKPSYLGRRVARHPVSFSMALANVIYSLGLCSIWEIKRERKLEREKYIPQSKSA